jgi:GNAT superfamily N-acetyltransferase
MTERPNGFTHLAGITQQARMIGTGDGTARQRACPRELPSCDSMRYPASMRIEPASLADYDEVCALDLAVAGPSERSAALREWISRGECLIARAGSGQLAGFAIANCSFFAQYFLVLLIVHQDHRRRGVASALIRAVEARSPTPKLFTSTNQSNAAMHAVCESLGFVRSGVIENLDDGDPEIIYFKRVG